MHICCMSNITLITAARLENSSLNQSPFACSFAPVKHTTDKEQRDSYLCQGALNYRRQTDINVISTLQFFPSSVKL